MNPSSDQARDAGATQSPPQAPETVPVAPGGTAGVQERRAAPRLDRLPPYRVLLHNDDVNDMFYVVETLCDLTPLMPQRAAAVMIEAHRTGTALVLMTHRERAELYVDQFRSKQLRVTIEPGE